MTSNFVELEKFENEFENFETTERNGTTEIINQISSENLENKV